MRFLNMKFIVASATLLACCISTAETKSVKCDENQPIVIDSCVTYADPNVESEIASANCRIYNDPNTWECDGDILEYKLRETLYFPLTNQTVVRKTNNQIQFKAWGKENSGALDRLRSVLTNLPGSILVTQRCAK